MGRRKGENEGRKLEEGRKKVTSLSVFCFLFFSFIYLPSWFWMNWFSRVCEDSLPPKRLCLPAWVTILTSTLSSRKMDSYCEAQA